MIVKNTFYNVVHRIDSYESLPRIAIKNAQEGDEMPFVFHRIFADVCEWFTVDINGVKAYATSHVFSRHGVVFDVDWPDPSTVVRSTTSQWNQRFESRCRDIFNSRRDTELENLMEYCGLVTSH